MTIATQAFAGIGATGIGLGNEDNQGDVLSVLGHAVFGNSTVGSVFTHLLILMVLTSAAASTQTTILPTARTTLSMAFYRAMPDSFGRVHKRHLTPSVSTVVMGVVSVVVYVIMNYLAGGNLIADSVAAIGLMIAFYYGLTGFACAWHFRKTLRDSPRNLWMRGILPGLGGVILFFAMIWSVKEDWLPDTGYTSWTMPFPPHWHIGGVFIIGVGSFVLGIVLMEIWRRMRPRFFTGATLRGDVVVTETGDIVRRD